MLTLNHGAARGLAYRELELSIRDDGSGIPQSFRRVDGRTELAGMGLQTMAYRAQCIGALLRVDSGPTGGTVVRCQLLLPDDLSAKSGGSGLIPGSPDESVSSILPTLASLGSPGGSEGDPSVIRQGARP